MTYVVLVRHGESESNVLQILDDNPDSKYKLTEIGRGQVEYTAGQLKGIHFDSIISSPILRTRETADILNSNVESMFKVDRRLTESCKGTNSGKNYNQLLPLPRGISGQEPWEKIIERFVSLFSELNGTHLLVSHALPIKAVVSHYLGLPDERSAFGIDIKLASASVIDLSKNRVLCIASLVLSDKVRRELISS